MPARLARQAARGCVVKTQVTFRRWDEWLAAILITVLIVIAALLAFEMIGWTPGRRLLVIAYVVLVLGHLLVVQQLRKALPMDVPMVARWLAPLQDQLDRAQQTSDGVPASARNVEPYRSRIEWVNSSIKQARTALAVGSVLANRCARRVIPHSPLWLGPLLAPTLLEFVQRVYDWAERAWMDRNIDQAARLAEEIEQRLAQIEALGSHVRKELKALDTRVQTKLNSAATGANAGAERAALQDATRRLKALLDGPLKTQPPPADAVVTGYRVAEEIRRLLEKPETNTQRPRDRSSLQPAQVFGETQKIYLDTLNLVDTERSAGQDFPSYRQMLNTQARMLDTAERRLRSRRSREAIRMAETAQREITGIRTQIEQLAPVRRQAAEKHRMLEQQVNKEWARILDQEAAGYSLDRSRPLIENTRNWLGRLATLAGSESVQALAQVDSIDEEIGARLTDLRTLGAFFSQYRFAYEQLRAKLKGLPVETICHQVEVLADDLERSYERYRQGVQIDALRQLSRTAREAELKLVPHMTQPLESRLKFLVDRLKQQDSTLAELQRLSRQAQQQRERRDGNRAEAVRRLDELDRLVSKWQALGVDPGNPAVASMQQRAADGKTLRGQLSKLDTDFAHVMAQAGRLVTDARRDLEAGTHQLDEARQEVDRIAQALIDTRQALQSYHRQAFVDDQAAVFKHTARMDDWQKRLVTVRVGPFTQVQAFSREGNQLDGEIRQWLTSAQQQDSDLRAAFEQAEQVWKTAQQAHYQAKEAAQAGAEWNSPQWHAADLVRNGSLLEDAKMGLLNLGGLPRPCNVNDVRAVLENVTQFSSEAQRVADTLSARLSQELGDIKALRSRLDRRMAHYGEQLAGRPKRSKEWTNQEQHIRSALQHACRASNSATQVRDTYVVAIRQVDEVARQLGLVPPPATP